MTVETNIDRLCFDLSSKLAEPFCQAFGLLRYRLVMPLGKFDHYSPLLELGFRTAIVAAAIMALYLPTPILCGIILMGAASKIFRALGCFFQKNGYTHVRGSAPEKPAWSDLKVMTWNILGLCGGMHYNHGGVVGWPSRIDGIVQRIRQENPDVLILQEIYDTALGEALIARLSADYAHFFTHLGSNIWGSEGGCMVITKCAVDRFTFTSFDNNDWTMNRGFAELELQGIRIIGTHLQHGDNQAARNAQMAQIVKRTLNLPTVIAGDLNTERGTEWDFFQHGYLGNDPTCTNRLNHQWDSSQPLPPEETIDYISLFKGSDLTLENGHLVTAFDETYHTGKALSDHHGVALTIKGLNRI